MRSVKKMWVIPKLVVHGDVDIITQQNKEFGPTDGFTLEGIPITNAS
jgi:hypothetical protein